MGNNVHYSMVSIPSDVSSWMKNSWLKYLFPNFIHIFKFTSTSTQHLHVVLWLATNSPSGQQTFYLPQCKDTAAACRNTINWKLTLAQQWRACHHPFCSFNCFCLPKWKIFSVVRKKSFKRTPVSFRYKLHNESLCDS